MRSIRARAWVAVAALGAFAFLPPAASAQGQDLLGIPGCFAFSRPFFAWRIVESWSRTVFDANTNLIELRADSMDDGPRGQRFAVQVPGLRNAAAQARWYERSHWRLSGDSVVIEWADADRATIIRLRWHGDSLTGSSAFYYSGDVGDFGTTRRPPPPVIGRRVVCQLPRDSVMRACAPGTREQREPIHLAARSVPALLTANRGGLVVRIGFDAPTNPAVVPTRLQLAPFDGRSVARNVELEVSDVQRETEFESLSPGRYLLAFALPIHVGATTSSLMVRAGFVDTIVFRISTGPDCLLPSPHFD